MGAPATPKIVLIFALTFAAYLVSSPAFVPAPRAPTNTAAVAASSALASAIAAQPAFAREYLGDTADERGEVTSDLAFILVSFLLFVVIVTINIRKAGGLDA